MPIQFNLALLVNLACAVGVLTAPGGPSDARTLAGRATAADAAADLPPGIPGDWWAKVQHDIQQSESTVTDMAT